MGKKGAEVGKLGLCCGTEHEEAWRMASRKDLFLLLSGGAGEG